MHIRLLIHPINTEVHTTIPPGWRWAVMAAGGCANAGWCPTQREAELEGEMVAVTAVKVARLFGMTVDWRTQVLDYDPVPADAPLGTPA